ncbi:MAG: hypothetical protein ACOYL6_09720 [Bacteriovoracaceae bacterium]
MKKYFLLFLISFSSFSTEIKPTTEFYTFWGGLKRIARTYWNKGEMVYLKEDNVLNRPLPIYISKSKTKRPVIILFVGVFGRPDGIIVPGMIADLEKNDVHLLVIPSFISETYIMARVATANKNIWEEEASNQIALVRAGLNLIGQENISSLHVVAESLGVWQAIMLLEGDWNFESFSLLSPPLHLSNAVDRFDQLIKKNKVIYDDCSYWWRWPILLKRYYSEKLPSLAQEEDVRCYGAWGIQSFLKGIEKVGEIVYKDQKLEKKKADSFRTFVELVTPEFLPFFTVHNDKLDLYYWKKQMLLKSKKLQMISALDDFLNDKEEWDLWKQDPDFKDKIKLYPYGGHSGELGEDLFWQDLSKSLNLND